MILCAYYKTPDTDMGRQVQRKGYTLVPLRLYFNSRGWAKIELALALGKKPYDKREALAKKSAQREIERGKKQSK